MAVAFDAAATADGTGTSLTFSHTCGGSATAIAVGVETYQVVGSGGPDLISGVSYAGVACSELGRTTHGIGDAEGNELWGKASPSTGSNDVVISASAPLVDLIGGSVSFTGGDTAAPFGTASTFNTDNVTTATLDISSASGDMVLDAIGWYDQTITVGADQTERVANDNGVGQQSLYMSTQPGAATVTMSWTWPLAEYPGQVAVNVRAAYAGPTFRSANIEGYVASTSETIDKPTGTVEGDLLVLSAYSEFVEAPPPTFVDNYEDIGTTRTTVSFNWGTDITGEANDDIAVAYIYGEFTANPTSVPTGWNLYHTWDQTTGGFKYRAWVYWRRVSGDTGDVIWTFDDSVWRMGSFKLYRGCITTGTPLLPSTPVVDIETAQNTEPSHAGITIERKNSGLLFTTYGFSASDVTSDPSGFTRREVGTSYEIHNWDDLTVSPGATGAVAADLVNPEYASSILIELVTQPATLITWPSGFEPLTDLDIDLGTDRQVLSIATKTAGGSEPADYTLTFAHSVGHIVSISAWEGENIEIDVEDAGDSGNSTQPSTSITTLVNNTAVLWLSGSFQSGGNTDPPPTMTTFAVDAAEIFRGAYLYKSTAGDTGALTAPAGVSGEWVAKAISIKNVEAEPPSNPDILWLRR